MGAGVGVRVTVLVVMEPERLMEPELTVLMFGTDWTFAITLVESEDFAESTVDLNVLAGTEAGGVMLASTRTEPCCMVTLTSDVVMLSAWLAALTSATICSLMPVMKAVFTV